MAVSVAGVGLGGLGTMHLELLDEMDGVTVVAGVDVVREAREEFADAFDAPTYEDVEALLADRDLDAVTIVTPHAFHHEQAKACLEAGVHVHLEKPLTVTVEEGVDLVETAEARDRVLQVGYQRHLHPGFREFRRVLRAGELGDVHTVNCYIGEDWISPWTGSWRTDPALSGGGQLFDSGSHLLDLLLWTTDATPRTVTAAMDDGGHDVEAGVDVNSALAATLDGPDGTVTASVTVTGDGDTVEMGFHVWGTEGYLTYRDDTLTVKRDGETSEVEWSGDAGWRELNRQKLAAFVAAVRGERDVAIPPEDGLRVVAMTQAAYRSWESGEAVDAAALLADARET